MKLNLDVKNIDIKKGSKAINEALQKTTDISKKVSIEVQEKAKQLSDKTKNDNYIRRLKKYNPLFPDKYFSSEFKKPNMIVIVDDAVRRGIDVCEGAIGWLSNQNGMEVMHLYDEFVTESGIDFVPNVVCDGIYYVDKFDRNKFIQVECIFSQAHEERLAELKHIAYSLGAQYCSIEITETSSKKEISNTNNSISGKKTLDITNIKVSAKNEMHSSNFDTAKRSGKIEVEFNKNDKITSPTLKWFSHDNIIKNLIDMRCNNSSAIKKETFTLSGATSATMSKKTANAIDGAVGKIGASAKSDFEKQAVKEFHSNLIFYIEF